MREERGDAHPGRSRQRSSDCAALKGLDGKETGRSLRDEARPRAQTAEGRVQSWRKGTEPRARTREPWRRPAAPHMGLRLVEKAKSKTVFREVGGRKAGVFFFFKFCWNQKDLLGVGAK